MFSTRCEYLKFWIIKFTKFFQMMKFTIYIQEWGFSRKSKYGTNPDEFCSIYKRIKLILTKKASWKYWYDLWEDNIHSL